MNTRFGPFEVDLESRRLLKKGIPIALREQSFQVLAALIERPGEIVTREELRKRLWSADTFVDFEVALNSAVSRLRDALGDSADSPSFIETISKRGYRFVVPIAKRPAVAVMPFVNQTTDAKDEYFSDGLTDELIRVLSRNDGLESPRAAWYSDSKGSVGMQDRSPENWVSKRCWKGRSGDLETGFVLPSTSSV